jgi:hypothetical protein
VLSAMRGHPELISVRPEPNVRKGAP